MSFLRLARNVFRRRQQEEDLDEEIRAHLELMVEEKLASGMDDQAARRAVRLEGGGLDQIKEAVRDVRRGARRDQVWRDARLATRRLIQTPIAAAAIVSTLLVGLGTFAVVYTVVQKILLDPLPYKDPDDLYFVWRDYGRIIDMNRGSIAGTDVAALQEAGGAIEGAVGLRRQLGTLSVKEGTDPIEIGVMLTSPNLFELLGVAPALGRGFAPSEVGPGRSPVIVLTHELWNRLGADPAIVGTDVRLNGQLHRIIGVMPPSFAFVRTTESLGPPQPADAFATFDIHLANTSPGGGSYSGLIRARRGTLPQTVMAAVEAVGRTVDARDFQSRGLRLYAVGVKPDLVARVRPALLVLACSGVFMLFVLMVNLASVLLGRAAQREHEFAVSRALGANSVAISRAILFEGALLGVVGGALGALAATWGTRVLVALAPHDLPRRESIAIDWSIAAVVISVGVLLGLLAATAPALWAARASMSSLLAATAGRGGGGRGGLRRTMIVAQVALSLVLLSSGGLVARSFDRLLDADPGFRSAGRLTFRLPMPTALFPDTGDVFALHDRIEGALAAIPDVTGVSAADALPLAAPPNSTGIAIPGAPGNTSNRDRDWPVVDYIGARAGYIEVMGMRLRTGRTFTRRRSSDVREALIDSLLARQFFPTGSPLGITMPFRDGLVTIVGVVDQARMYNVHQDGRPQLFVRAEDWGYRTLSFVVRTRRDPQFLISDVRAAIRRIEPRLAVAEVRTMDEIVSDTLRQQRLSAVLIVGFACGALLLAAMGLVSVVSGSVTRRRHELALRIALGAKHQRILRLVVAEGAWLVGLGVMIGMPGIYVAGRVIRGVLVGVSPSDPPTLFVTALGLLLVGIAACYLPARRVLTIDPAQSLRQN